MLDIKFIRENPQKVKEGALAKNIEVDVDELLSVDEEYRNLSTSLQELYAKRNRVSKEQDIESGREIKSEIDSKEAELNKLKEKLDSFLGSIPNLPSDDVKTGKNEDENEVVKNWGDIRDFKFNPRDHLELGEALDIIDIKRAAKVSGTRFAYLKNEGVLLEFALVQFALDTLIQEGFSPIVPPVLLKRSVSKGLGYFEGGDNEEYYWVYEPDLKSSDPEDHPGYYLAGTAEHMVVPIHKDEVLLGKDLPKRYVAFSSSFRREAGSYGKDTRGIIRVHQFDKVEMVSFTKPENGDEEHAYFLALEEKLFQALKLPYQIVKMCSGDLGFPVARKFDIEAWIPTQNKYRELTSTSTTTDFQARRLNIKYQDGADKNLVHILNGTAFAIGRTIVAILENYQEEDGSVVVPEVLRKYMGGLEKISPKQS